MPAFICASHAHTRNGFWKLVGALVDEDLYGLPYDERLPRLLAHRVGLWDVLAACERAHQWCARPIAPDALRAETVIVSESCSRIRWGEADMVSGTCASC